jgi:hypothetical protein
MKSQIPRMFSAVSVISGISGTRTCTLCDASLAAFARICRFEMPVHRSCHHLVELINGVPDLSQLGANQLALRRECVDLKAIPHRTADSIRPPFVAASTRQLELAPVKDHPHRAGAIRDEAVIHRHRFRW